MLNWPVWGSLIKKRTALIQLFAVVPGIVAAQGAPARPAFDQFEVASIRPAAPGNDGRWIRMMTTTQFSARNHTLTTLIAAAYNLNPRNVAGGPKWANSDRFDILAKAPGEVRPNLDEQMAMLRRLLSDRFSLKFHLEQRPMPAYALMVDKGGPKLKQSDPSANMPAQGPPPLIFVVSRELVRLPGRSATMGELASVLQRAALDRPVLDRTGLTSRFDFDLEFTPDDSVFGGALGKGPDNPPQPGLFTALRQELGLRMVAVRGPVNVLVIDHAELPSAN